MTTKTFLMIAIVLAACGDDGDKVYMDAPGGGGDASTSDGPRGDGSTGGDAAVLVGPACSGTTCMNGVEVCCLANATNLCRAPDMCPSRSFYCDGAEDCNGGNCCYAGGGGGTECRTQDCQNEACHNDSECPTTNPKCCPEPFTPGYNVCKTAC